MAYHGRSSTVQYVQIWKRSAALLLCSTSELVPMTDEPVCRYLQDQPGGGRWDAHLTRAHPHGGGHHTDRLQHQAQAGTQPTVEEPGHRCRPITIYPPPSLKIVFPSPAFCYYFRLSGPLLPLFSPFWIFSTLSLTKLFSFFNSRVFDPDPPGSALKNWRL
jgi:hypothetical protein